MIIVQEFFARLGLDVNAQSFAKGQLAANAITFAARKMADAVQRAITGVADLVLEVADLGDQALENAQRLGVSVEAVQELAFAAQTTGTSFDAIKVGIRGLSNGLQSIAKGKGPAVDAFKALGISLRDPAVLAGDTDKLLMLLADRFASMPDGTKKTALAVDIFGRSAQELIPFLNKGATGLEDLRRKARESGAVMSKEAAKSGDQFNDTLLELKLNAKGLAVGIVSSLLPALNKFMQALIDAKKFGKEIAAVLGSVLLAAIVLNIKALGVLALGWLKVAAATALAMLPYIAMTALIAGLVLIIEDLFQTATGGKGIIMDMFNEWKEGLDEWVKPRQGDPWWLTLLKKASSLAADALENVLTLGDALAGDFEKGFTVVSAAGEEFQVSRRQIGERQAMLRDQGMSLAQSARIARTQLRSEAEARARQTDVLMGNQFRALTPEQQAQAREANRLEEAGLVGGMFGGPTRLAAQFRAAEATRSPRFADVSPMVPEQNFVQLDSPVTININGANKDPKEIATESKKAFEENNAAQLQAAHAAVGQ